MTQQREMKAEDQHPEGLTQVQENLSSKLFEIGAIKFGEFKLKLHDTDPEAPLSPLYIDLRVLRRFPDAKEAAVDVYEEMVNSLEFNLLADVPTAATPLVSTLSDRLNKGMITPREKKTHGSGASIDGFTSEDKGKKVLPIDDLVTRALSGIAAINTLREAGLEVTDFVVLIDREQGGKAALEAEGITLHYAFTMAQMIDYYLRVGKISQEEYKRINDGLEAFRKYQQEKESQG